MTEHQWRCSRCLNSQHLRAPRCDLGVEVLTIALPIGGDVSGVADRDAMQIGSVAERVDDLHRSRLLSLDPIGIDRVDEGKRQPFSQLLSKSQRIVEVTVHGKYASAVGCGLSQLALRNPTFRHQHKRPQAATSRIGGCRSTGIAGRRAEHGRGALLHRLGDSHDHSAILERAGGVAEFKLQPDLVGAGCPLQALSAH